MSTIKWSGYEWLTQERWGQIHEKRTIQWYDESAINIDENEYLHLKTQYNPKYFPHLGVSSSVGVGLVSCTEQFGFGEFEIEAKLPSGKGLWPAFWCWSFDTWPPEIDMFEGYTNKCDYFKFRINNPFGFWNVQTNIHYRINGEHKSTGGKTHWFGFKNPAKHFIKYKLIWKEDLIEIYYNNRLVKRVTDKVILEEFNKTKMNILINNAVMDDIDVSNPPKSDFVIKYFSYKPL